MVLSDSEGLPYGLIGCCEVYHLLVAKLKFLTVSYVHVGAFCELCPSGMQINIKLLDANQQVFHTDKFR